MSKFLSWYQAVIQRQPLLTKSTTSGIVFGLTDCGVQRFEGAQTWDSERTARMMAYTMVLHTPFVHYWFRFLDQRLPSKTLGQQVRKMVVDQSIAAPIVNLGFFTATGFMEGLRASEVKDRVQASFFPTLKTGYLMWPAVQIVNFRYVPLQYQILPLNCAHVVWSTYLSYAAHKSHPQDNTEADEASASDPVVVPTPSTALSPLAK